MPLAALPSAKSRELKCFASPAASGRTTGSLRAPSSPMAWMVTMPSLAARLMTRANPCSPSGRASRGNSGMPLVGAVAERLVKLPPGASSRLIAWMSWSAVMYSRHLPAPSPNIPDKPAAPASKSSALTVRAAPAAKVKATFPFPGAPLSS